MNMLNNIHSLVDVDPKEAQKVIIELSKLMRHFLYESEGAYTALGTEIDMTSTYVDLMKVRYPEDRVKINVDFPSTVSPTATIPSLIIMPLMENAFKHGVSYLNETIIDVKLTETDGEIRFSCCNTKPPVTHAKLKGGIGLTNVRRRLTLLYGTDEYLEIKEDKNEYCVFLTIPKI